MTENIPLPITGAAICNALGPTRSVVRDALYEGRSGLTPCTVDVPFATYAGAIDVPLPALPTELEPWTTRTAQIALMLVEELGESLQRMQSRWRPDRIAVVLGTSTAGADRTEAAYQHYIKNDELPEGYDLWRHHTYGAILHVVCSLIGATGPSWVISTACTSSAKPFASAQRMIAADMVDAVLVGGIDTLCAMTLRGFHSLGALSSEPTRPFSAERKGISIGEGGAFVLVERPGTTHRADSGDGGAEKDAIAWLDGVGESSDAYHISAPHPKGEGAVLAMQRALDQAGCAAGEIDHINAHGTGTTHNDSAEANAIFSLFGDRVPVVSTKAYTGHTLGGAGATEAVIAMIALDEGWIPPALGVEPVDPKVSIQIEASRVETPIRRVLSNSFAFGGNNISLLLRRA